MSVRAASSLGCWSLPLWLTSVCRLPYTHTHISYIHFQQAVGGRGGTSTSVRVSAANGRGMLHTKRTLGCHTLLFYLPGQLLTLWVRGRHRRPTRLLLTLSFHWLTTLSLSLTHTHTYTHTHTHTHTHTRTHTHTNSPTQWLIPD